MLAAKQGKRQTAEYALEFHVLAAGSGWNEPVLKATFHRGLDLDVLMELACRDDQITLLSTTNSVGCKLNLFS